jgi:hypothetical protein
MKTNSRRSLIKTCLLAAMLLAGPAAVQAQFTYITNNGTITITGYTGSGGNVTILSTINGLPVTSIGDFAFENSNPTSVTIPDGVTNIEYFAFGDCYSLTGITVTTQNPVYSSMDGVLFDKNQTTLIQYPTSNTATNYTIQNSVTDIGYGAFDYCTSLASVTIGTSLTNISDYAFADCYNLTSVYFAGNTPVVVNNLFILYTGGDPIRDGSFIFDSSVIYYLPGTAGWSNTFAGYGNVHSYGLPTALWLPQVQTDDASFGVQNNQFGFNIAWASGQTVIVEACTNLSNPVWRPVSTNTLVNGSSYFSDPQSPNLPSRFYRLRSL